MKKIFYSAYVCIDRKIWKYNKTNAVKTEVFLILLHNMLFFSKLYGIIESDIIT